MISPTHGCVSVESVGKTSDLWEKEQVMYRRQSQPNKIACPDGCNLKEEKNVLKTFLKQKSHQAIKQRIKTEKSVKWYLYRIVGIATYNINSYMAME